MKLQFLYSILFNFINLDNTQIFQYFIVNNEEKTSKVIDTMKLPSCTHLDQRDNVTLRGGIKAGKFTKHGVVSNMNTCIDECCQDETCDVAFMPGVVCFTVSCYSDALCESIPAIPSNLAVNGVQISHIIRDGRKGNDIDEFRQHNDRNFLPDSNHCILSRVAYNQTIIGGFQSGEIIDFGKIVDIRDCANKCCQHRNCDVAVMRNNKCYAIDCFSKSLCDSYPSPSINGNPNMLVYMNKRNGQRQTRKTGSECEKRCLNGICANEFSCVCDVGWKGLLCDVVEIEGRCNPPCGVHGKCNRNDTCVCAEGWNGYKCDQKISCRPSCINGLCIDANLHKCKCEKGWSGSYCNISLMDRDGIISRDDMLFSESGVEPKHDIFNAKDQLSLNTSESLSALAVAIACGVAASILGTAAIMFIGKQALGMKTANKNDFSSKRQIQNCH